MKKLLLLLISSLIICNGFGQQFSFGVSGGGNALLPTKFLVSQDTIVVCGVASLGVNPDAAFVAKMDFSGNVKWSIVFDQNSRFDAMCNMANGDIVAVGSITTVGEMLIARITQSGDTVWVKRLSSFVYGAGRYVEESVDGDIIISGARGPSSGSQEVVVKLSSGGNILTQFQQFPQLGSHIVEQTLIVGDSIITIGTSRVGSFSSKEVSIRVVDVGGSELLSRTFGTPGVADNLPSMSAVQGGYVIVNENSGGIGLIRLDANMDKVDALSARFVSSGNSIQNPEVLVSGEFAYLCGQVNVWGNPYGLVAKIDLSDLSVVWTRVVSDGGLVTASPAMSGNRLVLVLSQGSSTRVSCLDTLSGQFIGVPCDIGLPVVGLEAVPLTLNQVDRSLASWVNPGLVATSAFAVQGLSILLEDCDPVILPVELIGFDAEVNQGVVRLDWQTATEMGSQSFTVERSTDGETFKPMGTIPGAGNSQTANSYEMFDSDAPEGVVYYKLTQKDFDGTTSDLGTVSVLVAKSFAIYPNPVSFGQTLNGLHGQYSICSLGGVELKVGFANGSIFIDDLSVGVYVLRLDDGTTLKLYVTQ